MYRIHGIIGLQDIRFIVMCNAFPPNRQIHKRFDLKVSKKIIVTITMR